MDPVSQGSLGASLAQSAARPATLRAATLCGALGGLAPDLDVLIQSAADPLLFLEYHRQFTHALIFIPLGALVVAAAAYPVVRRSLSARSTYLFSLAGYATHGLLDACTSYGTQLFWPFSDVRVAWNNVSVVDPLLTVPLLAGIIAAALSRRRVFALAGLIWAVGYLSFGVFQQHRALAAAHTVAGLNGHVPERMLVKPGFGNLVLWKVVYESEGRYFVQAVRVTTDVSWCPGTSVATLDPARDLPWLVKDSRQADDLARFHRFSAGYLAPGPDQEVFDVRYSNVPNDIAPLWGIRLDPSTPDDAVGWWWRRRVTDTQRETLIELLRGEGCRELPAAG